MTMDTAESVPIPEAELVFKASRSSGPGGQNVNKLNTRVTVLLDVAGSPTLSQEQKQQVLSRLAGRIDKDGVLHVAAQKHRSQEANRRAAVERLQQLVQEALEPVPVRRKTRMPAAARERRLQEKKQRSGRKQQRRGRNWGED
ncbi:MAG: aminoacyl-tRNA hydrolase [Planctomycetes bacterium]|nr:aminoacyl-tRNA hydrolase [Planctomycetota bacterium]